MNSYLSFKLFLSLLYLFLSTKAFTQTPTTPQTNSSTVYEYKKYEKIDLGDLNIEGEIIAPSDITIREKEREKFKVDLFIRKNSDDLMQRDIGSVR